MRERFNREGDALAISTIVLTELLHGAAKSARPESNRLEVENFARKYASRLAYLNDKLAGREFLLESFSVADAYLATVLNWTQATPDEAQPLAEFCPRELVGLGRSELRGCARGRASPRRWRRKSRCSGRR